jgi:cyclopropane fatty-acyl-phospholipid synthase-like methyltransferase
MSSSKPTEFNLDKEYLIAKTSNPNITFSKLEWEKIACKVEKGEAHETLGGVLKNGSPWAKAGAAKFKLFKSILKLPRTDRVLDYGCGTLRLGVHFIKYLNPNCYMGLDLIPEFIEVGKKLLGTKLFAAKTPELARIDELSLAAAENFSADAIISSDVAFHIHPDEAPDYFSKLSRVTCKSGARLVFDGKISDQPYRYNESGWSWPLDHYQEFLRPLVLVTFHFAETYYFDNNCKTGFFEFCRF